MPLPHSPFVESLLDLLMPLGGVSARRMFGGYGIYKDGLMLGLVDSERFFLKVDDVTRPTFEAEGLEPFRFTSKAGKVSTMSYFMAPEAALSSSLRMKPWALLGWQAADRQAATMAARPRKTSRGLRGES